MVNNKWLLNDLVKETFKVLQIKTKIKHIHLKEYNLNLNYSHAELAFV